MFDKATDTADVWLQHRPGGAALALEQAIQIILDVQSAYPDLWNEKSLRSGR
jgi:hypothetical protein